MEVTSTTDRTLTIEEVMQFSSPWLIGMTILMIAPHAAIHGIQPTDSPLLFLGRMGLLAVAFAVSVVVHEVLHVIAMLVFGRVAPRSISWGHRIREGVVYVHTAEPMSVRAYRGVLVLPGIVLGIVPVLIGWMTGNLWITVYGWLMSTAAVGDLAVFRLLRDLGSATQVKDHPEAVGVQVIAARQDVELEHRSS